MGFLVPDVWASRIILVGASGLRETSEKWDFSKVT